MPLAPGDDFPNLKLTSVNGRVELRDRWREGPLVVMFMRHFGCAFFREAYAQVEVGRGRRDQVLSGQIAGRYVKTIMRSRVVGSLGSGEEMLQLPGTFVVGSDGRVQFAHYAVSSADNPPVADVLAAVRSHGVSAASA